MFFYITLHRVTAHQISDHPADPFNRRAELYQTWHLCQLDALIEDPTAPIARWARQGFSLRGAPDDGTSYAAGDEIHVVDPQITFGLSEAALEAGKRSRYRFDVHYWESDGSATEKVRGAFSDATLNYLEQAWRLAKEDETKALAALEDWFDSNWQDIARKLVGAASPAALGVITSMNLLPLLDAILAFARSNGDDYHQMHRFVLDLRGTGGSLEWRVVSPSATNEWTVGPGMQRVVEGVRDGSGRNEYETEWRIRVID